MKVPKKFILTNDLKHGLTYCKGQIFLYDSYDVDKLFTYKSITAPIYICMFYNTLYRYMKEEKIIFLA